MLAVLGFVEQSVNFVHAMPESARLLMLGLGLLWSGAALRKSLRLDHAVDHKPFAFEELTATRAADFRTAREATVRQLVDR